MMLSMYLQVTAGLSCMYKPNLGPSDEHNPLSIIKERACTVTIQIRPN